MPTPQFVLDLRAHIGTAPLWLMGATAIVLRDGTDGQEVLLVKRSDSGRWAPISGIVDPGENPAQTAVREAAEEASVQIEIERLVWMGVPSPMPTVTNVSTSIMVPGRYLARTGSLQAACRCPAGARQSGGRRA